MNTRPDKQVLDALKAVVGSGGFREEAADLEPSEGEKLDLVLAFFDRMLEYRGEAHAMHVIRQKISWLGKSINGSHCKALKAGVRGARTPEEVVAAVEAWRRGGERAADAFSGGAAGGA